MPKYRTVEPVSFVKDGRVVSVKADRLIELDKDEARKLSGKILLVENKVKSMFPDGAPHIPVHIERPHGTTPIAGEPVAPEPKTAPRVALVPSKPDIKTESK